MENRQLKFKNGKFKIMLVGDLHERNDKNYEDELKSNDCITLLKTSIQALKPDLVVYMGDISGAEEIDEFRKVIKKVVTPCVDADVPFSLIFGNHDREHGIELKEILKLYQEYDNCITYNDDDSITGYGNCNILVKSTDEKEDILNLWFIDSNNLTDNHDESYYDWVHEDQIEWYENKVKKIKEEHGGKIIPAVLFQHIPVPEEYELLRVAKPHEKFWATKGYQKWSDRYYILKEGVTGYLGEGPCSPCYNSGQFDSWKKMGDVKGAFFGHDHMNDFAGYVDGIMLGQCKTAGFKLYTDGCNGGVRLLTFDENNVEDFETRMYYFKKDFHLKSKSIGLYQRHIHDRQDMNIKLAFKAAGSVAGAALLTTGVKKFFKALK